MKARVQPVYNIDQIFTLYTYHLAMDCSSHKWKLSNQRKTLLINENIAVGFYATLARQMDMLTSQEQLTAVPASVSAILLSLTRKGM